MAVALSAQCRPSAGQVFFTVVTVTGFSWAAADLHVAIGRDNSGPPATFGALSSPTTARWSDWPIYAASATPGGSQVTTTIPVFSSGAVGDSWWVMVFDTGPSGGTAPRALAGPFVAGP
jgi:hypothetical protein